MAAARLKLRALVGRLEHEEKALGELEGAMGDALKATGYADTLLGIRVIGVVTAASLLGETGDPLRFGDARQIMNCAGYSLREDSSGKSKSGTCISKRGRKGPRSLLYQAALASVRWNAEMGALYRCLTCREANPLKKKRALVVVSKKIITVIYSLLKKGGGTGRSSCSGAPGKRCWRGRPDGKTVLPVKARGRRIAPLALN
jgi:transposase